MLYDQNFTKTSNIFLDELITNRMKLKLVARSSYNSQAGSQAHRKIQFLQSVTCYFLLFCHGNNSVVLVIFLKRDYVLGDAIIYKIFLDKTPFYVSAFSPLKLRFGLKFSCHF